MLLHWFSPLPPASTDIAHYATRLLPALAERAEVVLWTNQAKWDKSLRAYGEVRRYEAERMDWRALNANEESIAVYHIGNNPLFHGSIWQVSRRHAGLVVLHDIRLHHFFDGLYREQWRDRSGYLAEMSFYYGETGRQDAAECFDTNARNINFMAEHYPLTPLALRHALGALTHTREAFDQLKATQLLPIAYAPLPFAAAATPASSSNNNAETERSNQETIIANRFTRSPSMSPVRLIVFGYIGHNRRLDALLRALAAMPERHRFQLDVYGQLLEEQPIRALIEALNLRKQVALRGFVSEVELDRALAQAHFAINLRYPTMGEASGSQLRIWRHSLPSLVTETGWYASLPPDTVAFARHDQHEEADIRAALRAFLNDPARFAEMGRRGRIILETNHAPKDYAETLIAFAERLNRRRTHVVADELSERAGAFAAAWLDATRSLQSSRNVATQICKLLGDS